MATPCELSWRCCCYSALVSLDLGAWAQCHAPPRAGQELDIWSQLSLPPPQSLETFPSSFTLAVSSPARASSVAGILNCASAERSLQMLPSQPAVGTAGLLDS